MNPLTENCLDLSRQLGEALLQRGWAVTTAESCTGGGLSSAITAIPGSSAWFGYGFVTYANQAKEKLLSVSSETLLKEGAVSEAVVLQMSQGALEVSGADLAVAISGVAGPDGGTDEKPVGSVWFAWRTKNHSQTRLMHIKGSRLEVQSQAVEQALIGLLDILKKTTA
jgi:nicotinamide-nucleotide amidase